MPKASSNDRTSCGVTTYVSSVSSGLRYALGQPEDEVARAELDPAIR